jgi:hypothetical protein
MSVRAYSVWPADRPEWAMTVNARNAGAAKYDRWLSIKDAGWDLPITAMRARSLGAPVSSEGFLRNAVYRGIPHVRCGDPILLENGAKDVVVGHTISANLDVLFDLDSPLYPGARLNVHPGGCTFPVAAKQEGSV